jgi:hypothetical protein
MPPLSVIDRGEMPAPRCAAILLTLLTAGAARTARADGASSEARPAFGYAAIPGGERSFALEAQAEAPVEAPRPPRREPPPVAFDVAFVTDAPLLMGGQLALEVPYRFLFQVEAGAMPDFFVNAIDGVFVTSGVYGQSTSDLIHEDLGTPFVLRLSTGWRPFTDHGFEILGGYTLTTLSAMVPASQALGALGMALPAGIPDEPIGLSSVIHSFHVALGWRWVVADHFLVRASLGYMQGVASATHVDVPAAYTSMPGSAPIIRQASDTIDRALDDGFKTYVKLPIVGLGVGYRF